MILFALLITFAIVALVFYGFSWAMGKSEQGFSDYEEPSTNDEQ